MKYLTHVLWGLLVILHGTFATASSPASLRSAGMTSEKSGRKLVLSFSTEVPPYIVSYNRKEKVSEVRWKESREESFQKDFMVSSQQGGISRVAVSVDPKTKQGLMKIWHDYDANYQLAKENGRELVLHLPKEPERQLSSLPNAKDGGRRVSLNVKDTPIIKILRSVASESSRNLVVGDEVTGNVSANVRNLPYEDAVNTILKATPYRAEHTGNVTVVRSDKTGKAFRSFRLQYIDVNNVLKTIQDVVSKDGQVSVDANTNTLFVNDRMDMLHNVEQMISMLDHVPRQVEVEAAIVELESKDGMDVGFDITSTFRGTDSSGSARTNLSSLDSTSAATKGMFVGLSWKSVSGILSMLATKSNLSVIAKPRVLALNDQEAQIIIGSQLGYRVVTVTQNGNIQDVKFITVGTQLKIKPHITQNGDMLMYIRPEISDGALDQTTGIPSTNTTVSESRVLAKDGQTIVIGGLLRDRLEKTVRKVPLLGDIPILGFLFRGSSENLVKTELVILLSPKIVNADVTRQMEQTGRSMTTRTAKELGITPVYGRGQ